MRLVQYNVRRMLSDTGSSTLPTILSTLRSLRPTVVTLNEVDIKASPDCLRELAAGLALPHCHFWGHAGQDNSYGNAILSAFPLDSVREIRVNGGTEVTFTTKDGVRMTKRIGRGALLADLRVPPLSSAGASHLTICCTHLDHIKEEERATQVDHVLRELLDVPATAAGTAAAAAAAAASPTPAFLCGDLNATRKTDYFDSEWQTLKQLNRKNGWDPPRDAEAPGGCVRALEAAGFVDSWRHVHGTRSVLERDPKKEEGGGEAGGERSGGNRPAGSKEVPPDQGPPAAIGSSSCFTAHVEHPRYRIDYVFANAAALEAFEIEGAFVDTASRASDHFPLVVDLKAKPTCAGDAGAAATSRSSALGCHTSSGTGSKM